MGIKPKHCTIEMKGLDDLITRWVKYAHKFNRLIITYSVNILGLPVWIFNLNFFTKNRGWSPYHYADM